MIDAPGPWGTGPFTLVEGHSSLDNEIAVISEEPFAATWFPVRLDRTPRVRLVANQRYWDSRRGPRLQEVVFRNDLTADQALELVCTTEGDVDIVTGVAPAMAERVERSPHAKLVADDAIRSFVGIFNRNASGLPLGSIAARQALSHAIDRDAIVKDALYGYASPLAGLTPPAGVPPPLRLHPYPHDPALAAKLWREAAPAVQRALRIAVAEPYADGAQAIATSIRSALSIEVDVDVLSPDQKLGTLREVAQRSSIPDWDILLLEWSGQVVDGAPLELHREFVGDTGGYRVGPVVPEFEALYAELTAKTSPQGIAAVSIRIDKLVYDQALALFVVSPQALYAVNEHVRFQPYRTTFELADCHVTRDHWSRRSREQV